MWYVHGAMYRIKCFWTVVMSCLVTLLWVLECWLLILHISYFYFHVSKYMKIIIDDAKISAKSTFLVRFLFGIPLNKKRYSCLGKHNGWRDWKSYFLIYFFMMCSVLLQAAPSFPSSFPHLFSSKDNLRCLIPCAIDQVDSSHGLLLFFNLHIVLHVQDIFFISKRLY